MHKMRRRLLVAGASCGPVALSGCAAKGGAGREVQGPTPGPVTGAAEPIPPDAVGRPQEVAARAARTARSADWEMAQALHALQRLTWGPRPGETGKLAAQSVQDWFERQLHPESIVEAPALMLRLEESDTLRQRHAPILAEFAGLQADALSARREPAQRDQAGAQLRTLVQRVQRQARGARLLRAVYAERQLEEVLVAFWFNHFNVFAGKETVRVTAGYFEAEAIRPHVLGRFRALLGATARHPAMLNYLDNWQSVAPGFRFPAAAQAASAQAGFVLPRGLNENYARELLELHTLGVQGGYSQDDITAAARILTGWSFDRRTPGPVDAFRFYAARHDPSPKRLLGRDAQGSGQRQGEWLLDLLARHPATAQHISFKLARHFVCDDPPQALVRELSEVFLKTDGDLRQLMRALVSSEAFQDPSCHGQRYKAPDRFVLSALRACGVSQADPVALSGTLARMGMPLYLCPTPDGWPDVRSAWLSPEALRLRTAFAQGLAANLARSEAARPERILDLPGLGAGTQAALAGLPPEARLALALASPDFSRY